MSKDNEALRELAMMTLEMPKRHGGRNRRPTDKQRKARVRNFSIYRLRGMHASFGNIIYTSGFSHEVNVHLVKAQAHVRDALNHIEEGQ